MKRQNLSFIAIATLTSVLIASCGTKDERKEYEEREEAKVGRVYDTAYQGIDHENRDNQFPVSRNDNREGTGQETGAPSDTTTVDEPKP
ncbi:MAG TPA: hypothetical protein VEA37_01480 [Flavobacterium sp.]|nr:hypothetical protein [Flavobacterium sp.]